MHDINLVLSSDDVGHIHFILLAYLVHQANEILHQLLVEFLMVSYYISLCMIDKEGFTLWDVSRTCVVFVLLIICFAALIVHSF